MWSWVEYGVVAALSWRMDGVSMSMISVSSSLWSSVVVGNYVMSSGGAGVSMSSSESSGDNSAD